MEIILLIVLLFIGLPALAVDSPAARFIEQERAKGIPVVGFSGDRYLEKPEQIQYDPDKNVSPQQKETAERDAAYFNWNPLPDPDCIGFIQDCLADSSIDMAHLQLAYLLVQPAMSDKHRTMLWSRIKTQYESDLQLASIQNYAANRNMPLQ